MILEAANRSTDTDNERTQENTTAQCNSIGLNLNNKTQEAPAILSPPYDTRPGKEGGALILPIPNSTTRGVTNDDGELK